MRLTAPKWLARPIGSTPPRDPRLPPPGATLTRRFQGRNITVEVMEQGFRYEGAAYRSLSAADRAAQPAAASPPRMRCAIYTRKSTEEGLHQPFNSLEAQREAAEAPMAMIRNVAAGGGESMDQERGSRAAGWESQANAACGE